MNLAVVFKFYAITNNYGLNYKFSSYFWGAVVNRESMGKVLVTSGAYTTKLR